MKIIFANSMVFKQTFFGKRPKAFKTVYVISILGKTSAVINCNMFTEKLQRFIRFKLIRIKHAAFLGMTNNLIHQRLCRNIIYNCRIYLSLSFQHSKRLGFYMLRVRTYIFFCLQNNSHHTRFRRKVSYIHCSKN